MIRRQLTLCVVHDKERMLLGMKKRGFGAGRWNGFGGKVAKGETIEAATLREILEECGIVPINMRKRGFILFSSQEIPQQEEVHVFSATEFSGEPRETEEMKPQWFAISDIPYADMWPDDAYWMPLLLAGKNFSGAFHFKDSNTILKHTLSEE